MRGLLMRCVLGALCLAACLTAGFVAPACGRSPARIVSTTFPVHLMVRNVIRGREAVRAELMLPAAMGCPHDYALTPQDMRKLAQADILVINGLGLEDFLGQPVRQANPSLRIVDSSSGLELPEATTDHPGDGEHDHAVNPHIFSSPRLAARMVMTIAADLARIDPDGAALYQANAARHAAELDALADALGALGAGLDNNRVAAPHEVFAWFARDAGLDIRVEFNAHAGMEDSAAAMLAAIARIRSEKVAAVLTDPSQADRLGLRISRETGAPLAILDPVDSGPDDAPPDHYLATMRRNLAVLERILGVRP